MSLSLPSFQKLTNETIQEAVNCHYLNESECNFKYGLINDWDTSEVTNMSNLFTNKKNFNADISKWGVSKVANMSKMFFNAESFNYPSISLQYILLYLASIKNNNNLEISFSFNNEMIIFNYENDTCFFATLYD
jgi:hypothetical protein